MGYTTDFIGHIEIEPPLNQHEQAYLAAFAGSRRCQTRSGPYDVPGNPAADDIEWDSKSPWTAAETDQYNAVVAGQPGLWCGWAVGWSARA
ncbi:hypothetical protein ABIB25_000561 [Nakamurella sp. UYEF19]|uniref:hypothetical protein n=1 Tax=Nakamurella sp. UYEF19 TaxID=1756392 RepID=UPI0033998F46